MQNKDKIKQQLKTLVWSFLFCFISAKAISPVDLHSKGRKAFFEKVFIPTFMSSCS